MVASRPAISLVDIDDRRIQFALCVSLVLGMCLPAWSDENKSANQSPQMQLEKLAFLAGHWVMEVPQQTTEEYWLAPKDGLMIGGSRTIAPGKAPFFEFTRIEVVGKEVHYVAQPLGRPPASFPLIELKAEKAVFENLKHDFPQRIIYEKTESGRIHATIEGNINGKSQRETWVYHKK